MFFASQPLPLIKSATRRRAEQAFLAAYTAWYTSEPDEELKDAYRALYAYQRRLWFRWWLDSHNNHGVAKRGHPEEALLLESSYKTALDRLRDFGDWLSIEVRFGNSLTARALRVIIAAYGDHILHGTAMQLKGDRHVMVKDGFREGGEEKGLWEPFLDGVLELGYDTESDVRRVFDKCLQAYKWGRADEDVDLLDYVIIDSLS